jgi:tRNA 2-selenouridine synthase
VLEGLARAGPRLPALARDALAALEEGAASLALLSAAPLSAALTAPQSPAVRVMCARGGLRSASVAWLLAELLGIEGGVATLDGGYKAFRREEVGAALAGEGAGAPALVLLGGDTGAGKTRALRALRARGEAVVDLEALANHAGSAFGALARPHRAAVAAGGESASRGGAPPSEQPTQEHFENLVGSELAAHARAGRTRVWMEHEARQIGRVVLPPPLFARMARAPLVVLAASSARRARTVVEDYGGAPREALAAAAEALGRRMGAERAEAASASVRAGNLEAAASALLTYCECPDLTQTQTRP